MTTDWTESEVQWIRRVTTKEPSDFHKSVIIILGEQLRGVENSTENARALATKICNEQYPEDAWQNFLNSFMSAAMTAHTTKSQMSLVHLLEAMMEQPDAFNSSNATIITDMTLAQPNYIPPGGHIEFAGARLFAGLPTFGAIVRELWNGPEALSRRWGSREAGREAWTNVNAFLAHVCRLRRENGPLAAWPEDFGLWTITEGLEDASGVTGHACAAAHWIVILGETIQSDAKWGGRDGVHQGRPTRQGRLWETQLSRGASQGARWEFWQQRFVEISHGETDDAETRRMCADAAHHMAQLGWARRVK